MPGTRVTAPVDRVVGGDTIRVAINNTEESLRLLDLDTGETNAGGGKPVTALGHKAKGEANRFFSPGDIVTLEFPGDDPVEVCRKKYRGNLLETVRPLPPSQFACATPLKPP